MLPAEIRRRKRTDETEMCREALWLSQVDTRSAVQRDGGSRSGLAELGPFPAVQMSTEPLQSDRRHLLTRGLVSAQGCDLNTSDSQTPPKCLAFLWIKLSCLQRGISWLKKKGCPPACSTGLSDV